MSGSRPLLLYDGDCEFCLTIAAALLRWANAAPIQGAKGDRWLSDLSPEDRLATVHLIDTAGRRHSGGDALLALAPVLGRAPGLTGRAYDLVAGHRLTLSRLIPEAVKRRAARRVDTHRHARS